MLEHSLDGLERDLADVRQRARDWTSRATMARGEGREDLALQALWRAAESVREAQEYEEEATAAREFLGQWDARCAAKGK
jgi:phage shock protein A